MSLQRHGGLREATAGRGGILRRIRDAALSVPLFVKVMGIALGPTVLMAGGLLWQIHETWHHKSLRELEERGELLGLDLSLHGGEFVLGGDFHELQRLLDEAGARFPDVEYLLVLDARGRPLAHTLSGAPPAELLAANGLSAEGRPRVVRLQGRGGPVRDVAVPILDGQAGVMRVGMSEQRVSSEVGWLARRLAAVTAVIATLGMGAAWFLTSILTRPVRELVRLTHAVAEGNYEVLLPVRARDEVGELATAFNDMTAALKQEETVRQKLMREVITAAEDERKRVARELHDHTGQALVSLIAGLGALEGGRQGREKPLGDLRRLAEQTLGEVHDLSRTLRPTALDDLGLVVALKRHCEMFARRLGMSVDCEAIGLDDRARLPNEVEVTVYRIVQEALTNTARHGRAGSVHVLLHRRDRTLLVVVEDDGRGFDASRWRETCVNGKHLGIRGIEERAALLGGTLLVESQPGSGASLFVEIPLASEEAGAEDSRAHRG